MMAAELASVAPASLPKTRVWGLDLAEPPCTWAAANVDAELHWEIAAANDDIAADSLPAPGGAGTRWGGPNASPMFAMNDYATEWQVSIERAMWASVGIGEADPRSLDEIAHTDTMQGIALGSGAALGAGALTLTLAPEFIAASVPLLPRYADALQNAWLRLNVAAYNLPQVISNNYFRGPEFGRWKDAGQWQRGWHFHLNPGLSPSLMQHHLPQQFYRWGPHFADKLEAWMYSHPFYPPL
jgi:hypothetical protein